MPVPLLRRAIRRRHSAVDEERGGRVVARHIYTQKIPEHVTSFLTISQTPTQVKKVRLSIFPPRCFHFTLSSQTLIKTTKKDIKVQFEHRHVMIE